MKKIYLLLFIIIIAYPKEFSGTGTFVSESKRDACTVALSYAKEEAMQHAGTLMLSSFESSTSVTDSEAKSNRERKIKQFSSGMTKLKSKDEQVKVDPDSYVFTCNVTAIFEIDDKRINEFHEQLLQDERARQNNTNDTTPTQTSTTDAELEKLKLQREIELLRLQRVKETNGSAQPQVQPVQQQYYQPQAVYQEPKNEKSNFALDLDFQMLYGDIQSFRLSYGIRLSQLKIFYGMGTDTVTYTGYYSNDTTIDLVSYDYLYYGVEWDFSTTKNFVNAMGIIITDIDPESIYEITNYIGETYFYNQLYSSTSSNYLYNEDYSYQEFYWRVGNKYIQFIMAIQSSYEMLLYQDYSYSSDESIMGLKLGLNLTLPLEF